MPPIFNVQSRTYAVMVAIMQRTIGGGDGELVIVYLLVDLGWLSVYHNN